jgi:hypothetical protein
MLYWLRLIDLGFPSIARSKRQGLKSLAAFNKCLGSIPRVPDGSINLMGREEVGEILDT